MMPESTPHTHRSLEPPDRVVRPLLTFALTCADFSEEGGLLLLSLGLVSLDGRHYYARWTWVSSN